MTTLIKPNTDPICAGYTAFNGHIFTQAEANGYSTYNHEIELAYRLKNESLMRDLMDKRCEYFKIVIGEIAA